MQSALLDYLNEQDKAVGKVQNLSKRFCDVFGISHFTYARIYNDGRMGWLSSNPNYDRLVAESSYLEDSPFVEATVSEGLHLWFHENEHAFQGSSDFNQQRQARFSIDHGFIFVKNKSSFVELCYLNRPKVMRSKVNLIINEMGLLNAFIENFKVRLNPALLQMIEKGIPRHVFKNSGKTAKLSDGISKERAQLIESFGMAPLLKLSRREKQSLTLFAKGYTYREIGEQLFLSERTIEQYIKSVKNKLNIDTRSELQFFAAKLLELKV